MTIRGKVISLWQTARAGRRQHWSSSWWSDRPDAHEYRNRRDGCPKDRPRQVRL